VPVSSSQVIVGAVVGIGLVKGGKNIRYNILGKVSLAWIAAPVIAFFFSFITLFIVQNVFEQTVYQKTVYMFNKTVINKIETQGLDTNHLSTVNGRKFDREIEVYKELKQAECVSRNQILSIIQIAEIYPLKVNTHLLQERGLANHSVEHNGKRWLNGGIRNQAKWQLSKAAKDYSGKKEKNLPKEISSIIKSGRTNELAISNIYIFLLRNESFC
jgi:PiT family inorganic phosphate transporter